MNSYLYGGQTFSVNDRVVIRTNKDDADLGRSGRIVKVQSGGVKVEINESNAPVYHPVGLRKIG